MTPKKIIANIGLLLLSFALGAGLIQDALFFYSFPPDPDRYIPVPVIPYILLGVWIFALFKLSHYANERAEVIPAEEEE